MAAKKSTSVGFKDLGIQNGANIYSEFSEAYNYGHSAWGQAWDEMKKDIEFVLGKQWSIADEAYLKQQGRSAWVFNKMMRIVKLISGYQRKTRLSVKADPVEGADSATAEQLTACLLWLFSSNQYYLTLSEAFESGELMSGINLVQVGMDYGQDLVNGDPQLYRYPYNQFLLDPSFTKKDLSDCTFGMVRLAPSKDQAKKLLPFLAPEDIDKLPLKGMDNRFPLIVSHRDTLGRPRMNLYYFWSRTTKPVWLILDKQTGALREVGDKTGTQVNQALEIAYAMHGDRFEKIRKVKGIVNLDIILQDQVVYHGADPTGIEDNYPFVPIMGTYVPEYDDWRYKIQALARQLRDPQTQKNKRMVQMLDIIESQINSGWLAKPRAVIDKDALYRSGQGRVVWLTDDAQPGDVEQLRGADVPSSHFQMQELMDREIPDISGVNQEMFGAPENENIEIAGILAKMRMAAGLVGLQEYFDDYRFAKQNLGKLLIGAIQSNWSPDKVKRVTGQEPTQAFFVKDFGRYDAAVTEGILTDTQRQMFYAELKAMRKDGYAVPVSLLVEHMPIQLKEEVKKALVDAEKSQARAAQEKMILDKTTLEVLNAQKVLTLAQAREKLTASEENRAAAVLERARAAVEIKDIGTQRALDLIGLMFEAQQRIEDRNMQRENMAAQAQQAGGQPV